jgi:hypothetical protein
MFQEYENASDDDYLWMAAEQLRHALSYLRSAEAYTGKAWAEMSSHQVLPDSPAARAQDYDDAIDEARRVIGNRLNTWDNGDYVE